MKVPRPGETDAVAPAVPQEDQVQGGVRRPATGLGLHEPGSDQVQAHRRAGRGERRARCAPPSLTRRLARPKERTFSNSSADSTLTARPNRPPARRRVASNSSARTSQRLKRSPARVRTPTTLVVHPWNPPHRSPIHPAKSLGRIVDKANGGDGPRADESPSPPKVRGRNMAARGGGSARCASPR